MKRTTLFANEEMMDHLKHLAEEKEMSLAELIRQALQQFLENQYRRKSKLSFLGIGRSRHHNIAERAEELLWKRTPAKQRKSS